jgi:Ca2+-binding RTX toxin-like protein
MRLTNASLVVGSATQTVAISNIENAELSGGNSANFIDTSAFSGQSTLFGLGGNDILWGGQGSNTLNGGAGNDWLSGSGGNDKLVGEAGSDILVGGLGVDDLDGDTGDDIVIGGRTNYDVNKIAIDAFLAQWVNKTSFTSGVNTLKTGFTVGGVTYKLNTTTVFDDDVTDTLLGDTGTDWFFADIAPNNTIGLENPDDTGAETSALVDL